MEFCTDSDVQGIGFQLFWNATILPNLEIEENFSESYPVGNAENDCGKIFFLNKTLAQVLNLTSPGFPGEYPNNLFCNITILAEAEFEIRIVEFVTEMLYDKLRIYAGSLAQPLGEFTGNGDSGRILKISEAKEINLIFTSDPTIVRKGFFIQIGHQNDSGWAPINETSRDSRDFGLPERAVKICKR